MYYYKVNSYNFLENKMSFEMWRYINIDDLEDDQPPNQFIHIELNSEKITYTSRYGKPLVISDDERELMFEVIRDYFTDIIDSAQQLQKQFNEYIAKK